MSSTFPPQASSTYSQIQWLVRTTAARFATLERLSLSNLGKKFGKIMDIRPAVTMCDGLVFSIACKWEISIFPCSHAVRNRIKLQLLVPSLEGCVADWKQTVQASTAGPLLVKARTTSSPWVSSACQWMLSLSPWCRTKWHPMSQWLLGNSDYKQKQLHIPRDATSMGGWPFWPLCIRILLLWMLNS